MKKITIILLIISSIISSCNSETNQQQIEPLYFIEDSLETNYITFDFDNIISFNYDKNQNNYYIEYSDYDAFDYASMSEMAKQSLPEYVEIVMQEEIFFQLLTEINTSKQNQFKLQSKYILVENIEWRNNIATFYYTLQEQ